MIVRRCLRPSGQLLTPLCSRGATSVAATSSPEELQVAEEIKQNREIIKRLNYGEGRPGLFSGVLSDFLGERIGVTGVYTLGIGLTAYAVSKQWLLINAETSLLPAQISGLYFICHHVSKILAAETDKGNIYLFRKLYSVKNNVVGTLQSGIDAANAVEDEVSVRKDVFDILRTNAAMYRDTLYRERQDVIRAEVLKRLQHQADLEAARRRVQQAHMITWIEREVVKDVATQLDEQTVMKSCLEELQGAVKEASARKATA